MDFEEMKVLWDSQNEEPLYAVNQAGLRAILRRYSRDFRRTVFWRDLREITIGIVAGAGLLVFVGLLAVGQPERLASWLNLKSTPTAWDLAALISAAGLWFHYALRQYAGRKRQERRERQFAPSVLGDLDREIARTEYQIRLAKNVLWWGVLPVWTATFLFLLVASRLLDTSGWIVLVAAAVFLCAAVLDLRWKQRPIQRDLVPRKHELESLRTQLVFPECYAEPQ
jgi:hypothetical protein